MKTDNSFISTYLRYTSQTECPTFFHRWCGLSCLATYLGRQTYFRHGHFTIYPNMYAMLVGSPGTKKSSAIKIGAKLLKQAGYKNFAAKKIRQEKFLLELAESAEDSNNLAEGSSFDILDQNLFGDQGETAESYEHKTPAECMVAADEFNNFIGLSNLDFISILGELWDYEGVYDYKLKNSKSVFIPNPTVNILGGNTPTGLSLAFPPETVGQGFFSRLLLIHAEPTGIKYTFPPVPDQELQDELVAKLHEIKNNVRGEVTMTEEAVAMLDKIYKLWPGIDDIRFEHYANRRLTHLIKLCMITSASRLSTVINTDDVIEANTVLTFTEQLMPRALGEFGNARNSGVTHKVMAVFDTAKVPQTVFSLWKVLHQDFESRNQLTDVVQGLILAGKVKALDGAGFIPVRKVMEEGVEGTTDWSILTKQERQLI